VTDAPFVSVYLPTHDRAELLERALHSVFAQTYSNYEIVVVDDGSSDGTPQVLERLARTGGVRAFRFDAPKGAQAARNHAIAQARFNLITGMDDDDEWLPDRLRLMVAQFAASVGFVAASDIVELADGTRHVARRPSVIDADALLRRNVVGNQVLARKADVMACGGFDESLTASQDYDLWIRLVAQAGAGIGITTPLQILHAQANRPRVTTSGRRRAGVWRVYRKHVGRMTREQRKSHLFNLIRTTDRPLPFKTATALWSREDALRIVAHYARTRGWLPDGLIEKWASFRDRAEIEAALRSNARPVPVHSRSPI